MNEQAPIKRFGFASGLAVTLAGVQCISLMVWMAICVLAERTLAAAAPGSELARAIGPLRIGLWGATALGALIALAIVVLVRERLARPIRSLSRALLELARGRDARLAQRGPHELAPLLAACDVLVEVFAEQRAQARSARQARDVDALCRFALRDPSGFADFKRELGERLYRAGQGECASLELHTVEGSAAAAGCEAFVEAVQACQSCLGAAAHDTRPVRDLADRFRELCGLAQQESGAGEFDFVVVRRQEYHQLLSLLHVRDVQFLRRARLLARSWSMHRVGSSLERLAKAGVRSAERQGKAVCVQVSGDSICLAKGELDELWGALPHLVRNAVAHGIEPSAERIARGKPAEGQIELRAEIDRGELKLTVTDDGRGIDWLALGARGSNGGVVSLFRAGVSTAPALNELAGRGLGLRAVQRTVTQVGGSLDVRSEADIGTTIQIRVPAGDDVYVPTSGVSLLPRYRSRIPPARVSAGA